MDHSTATIAAMFGVTDEASLRWIDWRNEIDRQVEAECDAFVQDVIAPWAQKTAESLDAEAK